MADQPTGTDTIGCAQRLRLGTWNCGGLSYIQRVLCDELGYDVLGLTETGHDTGRLMANRRFVVGEPAPAGDSAFGVAMHLSERTAACITHSGCIGSRIVYVRLRPPRTTCSSSVFTFHATSDGIRAALTRSPSWRPCWRARPEETASLSWVT